MGFVVTNMFMMTFTSYFFEGFVLVRVPFPLTNRFKVMLQRGIALSTLDASYVSSTSWYFLVMFGIKSVLNLFLQDNPIQEEAKAIQMQMGVGTSTMGFDVKKVFASEVRANYAECFLIMPAAFLAVLYFIALLMIVLALLL
ncbi:unnamed protein product [Choristocarpus tenellus]